MFEQTISNGEWQGEYVMYYICVWTVSKCSFVKTLRVFEKFETGLFSYVFKFNINTELNQFMTVTYDDNNFYCQYLQ